MTREEREGEEEPGRVEEAETIIKKCYMRKINLFSIRENIFNIYFKFNCIYLFI